MELFTEIEAQVQTLRTLLGDPLESADLVARTRDLEDAHAVAALTTATALIQCGERIRTAATGVVAARSSRAAGQGGLAQSRSHRNAATLVQEITGCTRAEAARLVRVGESLLASSESSATEGGGSHPGATDDEPRSGTEDDGSSSGGASDGSSSGDDDNGPCSGADDSGSRSGDDQPYIERPIASWHAGLDHALLDGRLTPAQHDAIRQGLADPPAADETSDERDRVEHDALMRKLWAVAADQLIDAAAHDTPEMLGAAARAIRDRLDPDGAARRFQERYSRRSFRVWTTADGHKRGTIDFDDEGFAWVTTIIANAMRPRTGGPRFIDAEEKARARALTDDPRTNDQLTYDVFLDLLRTGALADAATVFGTRRAGVRLITVVHADGIVDPIAHTEDHLHTFPVAVADQQRCDIGSVPVTVDSCGNPLDVGREHRLFTSRQRIALAIRDGGCRWTGCDRPASFGEAHHIDEWARDQGRTDIDRGILLCRFHHMQLHHGGWRITRRKKEDFVLHHSGGQTFALPPRHQLRYVWAGIDPPPKRFPHAA